MKIVHLTSVHTRFDTRIFLKQCRSLAAAGHDVTLVVADGKGAQRRDGVTILDVGAPAGRRSRVSTTMARVMRQARQLQADLYHLHDPELLPGALWLKRFGCRVVFDAHEDVPQDILTKPYIPSALRRPVSVVAGAFEAFAARRLDGVVAATPFIAERFRALGATSIAINNYPMADELESETGWDSKQREICYVGGLTALRGAAEIVRACELARSGARLNFVGRFQEASTEAAARAQAGWSRVEDHGFLDRTGVRTVLERSVAGLVTFLPAPNHAESQPNKMFEYMSAGIPVIASNFPLWRDIVEANACGICVDPLDPQAIADAIDRLVEDLPSARRMGENGRRAVVDRYNWTSEEEKLLDFYARLAA